MKSNFPKRIGILGGGQLAKLLALSAYSLGLEPVVWSRSPTDPAAQVTPHWHPDELSNDLMRAKNWIDGQESSTAIDKFLSQVDVVTVENEFIDGRLLKKIATIRPVYPSPETLELTQRKYNQKLALKVAKIPTAKFKLIQFQEDIEGAFSELGNSVIIKKSTMGYDGRGVVQIKIKSQKDASMASKKFLDTFPDWMQSEIYAEERVDFVRELAVVVARDQKKRIEIFPVIATKQEMGVCISAWAPTVKEVGSQIQKQAFVIARKVVEEFDSVGVFAIEMFLTKNGKLLVNEIAPRVHNSGHITTDACNISQFDQHLRAVIGLDLVSPRWSYKGAAMYNIIGRGAGDGISGINFDYRSLNCEKLHGGNARVYWYGKSGSTENRKLGHINVVDVSSSRALELAKKIRRSLSV